MAAAIFNKVELRSEEDLQKIEDLLHKAMQQYLKSQPSAQDTTNIIESTVMNAARHIKQFTAISDSDADGGLITPGGGHLASPALPPLSPPPIDAEVMALEKQVEEASKRVGELRTSMTAKIGDTLAAKLAECRPSSDIPAHAAPPPATAEDEGQQGQPMHPPVIELERRLREAVARLPEIRARLEDADARSRALLEAANEEKERPPPNTVERAVFNLEEEAVPSEAAAAAVQAGAVSTRRGRDVRPVPLPRDDDDAAAERGGNGNDA